MMREGLRSNCRAKSKGGMEEWANNNSGESDLSCDWYHGAWQMFRLLDMVAVPSWYPFYMTALSKKFQENPQANVFISAAADWGMLAMVHEAASSVGAEPQITIWDICETPILATQWYADRFRIKITSRVDNIILSDDHTFGAYDLIVTDEFLTVLADEYKPMICDKWFELLKPGGVVVTTGMVGADTTPSLRDSFSQKARQLLTEYEFLFDKFSATKHELESRLDEFAQKHNRHMLRSPQQLETLFANYKLDYSITQTLGECVNPTSSFQIVAERP